MIEHPHRSGWSGNTVLGILLVLFGVLFFAGQWFDIDVGQYLWPFLIIVPGVLLLLGGLVSARGEGGAMLPVGSAVTTVGLILLFQTITTLWASWAYIWALIPAAVGLGLTAQGALHGDAEAAQSGPRLLTIGLVLFALGALFFEGIVGLNGFGLRFGWAANYWPLLLVGLGVLLLIRNFFGGEEA